MLPSRPNIVSILTDDQRWDELRLMPNLQNQLRGNGVTFTNGFVSNPLCCTARATILTGKYSGHNGVWSNVPTQFGDLSHDSSQMTNVASDGRYPTVLDAARNIAHDLCDQVPPGFTWSH